MEKVKTVVIGISGGIAVYKVATLVRLFKKKHWNVIVVMTQNATKFVTPLTFETLSQNPVVLDTFKKASLSPNLNMEHIHLPDIADLFILAPATANILAKTAHGIADDILSTTILSLKEETPKILCPAMNVKMLYNPATKNNLKLLESFGYFLMPSEKGDLACGIEAQGRLPEPQTIFDFALTKVPFL